MRIIAISDTHDFTPDLPFGELLVHAGDLTSVGTEAQMLEGLKWLGNQKHKYKIFVAGNHDFHAERVEKVGMIKLCSAYGITYLQDWLITVDGLRIYGSPWVPTLQGWAFYGDDVTLMAKRDRIPGKLDLLITHGPPLGLLDNERSHYGDKYLRQALWDKKPRVHVFGHVHEGYGSVEFKDTTLYNVAICDREYDPIHPPTVIDLEPLGSSDPIHTLLHSD